ncbi:di-heme oxidoredictase family protein [Roseibium algae]|uniref:Di-heme oxidoredictase family protein n=1 Tax=Roseibium algae TaxID=3123038 RepID=A0ABU8TRF4_9HYPH
MIAEHRKGLSPKTLAATLVFITATAAPSLADAQVKTEIAPWDERVLTEQLDFNDLAKRKDLETSDLIESGQRIFEGKYAASDGAGRPNATQAIVPTKRRRPAPHMFQRLAGLDSNSCASCHNAPITGGAGDFTANVFVSEGFESADFDTIDPQFSNERGTNALQGAGLLELLAREMTAALRAQRSQVLADARNTGAQATIALNAKGVSFGTLTASPDGTLDISALDGIDDDLTVRPFGQKGVFASLRQFTVNALNHHHGLQATERFGALWTGTNDFDGDKVTNEVGPGQVSALVAWQATLPAPTRTTDLPEVWQAAATEGEVRFSEIGCAECHRPTLPLDSLIFRDPNPYDNAGTLRPTDVDAPIELDLSKLDWVQSLPKDEQGRTLVPLFGDLKRHKIADAARDTLGNELLGQRFVARDVFITAELWGIGSTAPYGHRGDLTTLDEIIEAHGGEATTARKSYSGLPDHDKQTIIAFLRSLEISK